MSITTGSVAISLEEVGAGFTARCHDLGLVAHAKTEETALRQLKEQLDRRCPGVRVQLSRDFHIYGGTTLRHGERRGGIHDLSAPVVPKKFDLSTSIHIREAEKETAATHRTSLQ